MSTSTTAATHINGVSVYNKAGKLKSNYTNGERLQILEATPEDLEDFMELFCPGGPHYAITRAKSENPRDWTTPKGRVSETEILNHLLGNLLPGKNPRWVAPRSWEVTSWVGIDVDLRKDDYADFLRRCKRVRQALKQLGVGNKHLLVSNTPSGGKHYRFFLRQKIRVCEIENAFRNIGIEECSGKFELFPRMKKGMRLPFGYLPGKPFQPKAWLEFIRRYRDGKIPLVDWRICVAKAERYLELHGPLAPHTSPKPTFQPRSQITRQVCCPENRTASMLATPKWKRICKATAGTIEKDEYLELLSRRPQDFTAVDAKRIWELGILTRGTRVEATKKIAWHLCHVKRLTVDEASRLLVNWVYQTGACTSQDVQQDVAEQTRKVQQQTEKIVQWTVQHPPTESPRAKNHSLVSQAEVDLLLAKLRFADQQSRKELLEFALNFLRYAKLHGEPTPEGWEAKITAAKVMRKWPRSSGSKYKTKRDLLEKIGLVLVTKKEWKTRHGGGRSRTYLIKIPSSLCIGAGMTIAEALSYAADHTPELRNGSATTTEESRRNDSYKRVVEATQRMAGMEGGDPSNLIQRGELSMDCESKEDRVGEQPTQICSSQHSPMLNVLAELQESYRTAAEQSLQLSNPRSSRSVDLVQWCAHCRQPLDLRRLREQGLSQQAMDTLVSRPANFGIPKAVRLELERVQSKTLSAKPPPTVATSAESLPPTSRSQNSRSHPFDNGAKHAHHQTYSSPGDT